MASSISLNERITQSLAGFERISQAGESLTGASVMVLVTRTPDTQEGSVVLTRRAKTLRRHAGQYALPGGRVETGETAGEAALRECRE